MTSSISNTGTSAYSSNIGSIIATIIKQNNDGIRMLETDDFAKAASRLSTCVAQLKDLLAISEEEQAAAPCFDLSFAFALESASAIAGKEDQDNSSVFLFEAPIKVVRRRQQDASMTTTDMIKRLSFAVVYNLAVAFHRGAVHHRSESLTNKKLFQRLRKALAFYQMACDLASEYDINVGSLEALALANNQAHIHQLLNEEEQARLCRSNMLINIMWVTEHGNSKEIVHFEQFVASAMEASPTATAA